MALNLIAPTGVEDVHGDNPDPLVFKWEVENDLLPLGENLRTNFFLSTQTHGNGLWPDDPIRERGVTSSNPSWTGDDSHPSRIYTVFDLKPGRWKVLADGTPEFQHALLPGEYELEFDPAYARSLTGGQNYYWGVMETTTGIRELSSFVVAPDVAVGAPFNGVTVLTHGFQLNFEDKDPFKQPTAFRELGRMIAQRGGGGVVLLYDKNRGNWVNMETMAVVTGADLGQYAGKPLVLVTDWVKESDYAEAGFAEAAADSIFAAIMNLNAEAGGSILTSPLHFIGHSRGTVVNSEIIQRIGWYKPTVGGIHMTALDPHDFDQDSLDIPIETLANLAKYAISFYSLGTFAAGVATAVGGIGAAVASGGTTLAVTAGVFSASGKALLASSKAMKWAIYIQKMQDTAKALGLQLDPIKFGDFLDPDVKLWSNIGFSENYYQDVASNGGVTGTPNGRDIGVTSISRYLNGTAGFNQDDFPVLGAGGAHSRVWQWYTGTVNTNINTFQGGDIFRRITDEGLRPFVFGLPSRDKYTDQPWYFITPQEITGSPSDRIGGANQQSADEPQNEFDFQITDGIGMGWYYSVTGGGVEFRPSLGAGNVPVTSDNTEDANPSGLAVQTIFNGDFEQGTRESLTVHLQTRANGGELGSDAGRFPISYEIPGFSFHGGSGFEIETYNLFAQTELEGIDVGALFTVNTNPASLIKEVLVKMWENYFDEHTRLANGFAIGNFKLPSLSKYELYFATKIVGWASKTAAEKLTIFNRYSGAANRVLTAADNSMKAINSGIDQLMDFVGAPRVDFGEDTKDEAGLESFKKSVSNAIEAGFDKLFPNKDNYALIMGASGALETLIDSFLPDGDPEGIWETLKGTIKQFLPGLNSVTHNAVYVPEDKPYFTFKIYKPYMLHEGASIDVTFESPGMDSVTQTVNLGTGFFKMDEYSVEVPQDFRGRAVTVTLAHKNMAPSDEYKQELEDAEFMDVIDSAARNATAAVSQIYLLDDLRFTALAAVGGVMPDAPILAAEGVGNGDVPLITRAAVETLLEVARGTWEHAGISADQVEFLASLKIEVVDLQGAALATIDGDTITIDIDAAGRGWFVDPTPQGNAEFAGTGSQLFAVDGGAADGLYDLVTVLAHEMGHALELVDLPGAVTSRIMADTIGLGIRRLPTSADLPSDDDEQAPATGGISIPPPVVTVAVQPPEDEEAQAGFAMATFAPGTPATNPLINGDFAAPQGWSVTGGGSVTGGVGVLAEDARFLTSLRQAFAVPAGAQTLSFTITSANLGINDLLPPDAFEVALIDPVTGESLLGALGGLDLSDAFLNLQADGTVYLAPGVTITGNPLTGPAVVNLSLAAINAPNGALLSFDLIGMGDLDSLVRIDNVIFGTTEMNFPPLARPDSVSVAEDGTALFNPLANDTDPEGDPLSVTLDTQPLHGTLTANPGGDWSYVADADYFGADSFTYTIRDNFGGSSTATVSISVSAVNDAPVIGTVVDSSASAGTAVSFVLTASDIDDAPSALTYSLVSGPAGASVAADGTFSWTASGSGAQSFTVQVRDADGAVSQATFSIAVTPAGNLAPVFDAIANQAVGEGVELSFVLGASDPDHASSALVYTLLNGPAGATVSADGTFRWVATGDAAAQEVTVRVTDPAGGFDQASFSIAVTLDLANTAPTLGPIADQAVTSGDVVILTLAGADAEDAAEALSYTLISGPAGAAVSAAGQFSWLAGDPGDSTVTVRVTDSGGLFTERTFAIAVAARPNEGPVLGTSRQSGGDRRRRDGLRALRQRSRSCARAAQFLVGERAYRGKCDARWARKLDFGRRWRCCLYSSGHRSRGGNQRTQLRSRSGGKAQSGASACAAGRYQCGGGHDGQPVAARQRSRSSAGRSGLGTGRCTGWCDAEQQRCLHLARPRWRCQRTGDGAGHRS